MAKKQTWMNLGKLGFMVVMDSTNYGLIGPQDTPLTECNQKHIAWYLTQEGFLDEINQNRKAKEEN